MEYERVFDSSVVYKHVFNATLPVSGYLAAPQCATSAPAGFLWVLSETTSGLVITGLLHVAWRSPRTKWHLPAAKWPNSILRLIERVSVSVRCSCSMLSLEVVMSGSGVSSQFASVITEKFPSMSIFVVVFVFVFVFVVVIIVVVYPMVSLSSSSE